MAIVFREGGVNGLLLMRHTKVSRLMNQSDREENKSKDSVERDSFIDEGIARRI